MRNQASEASHSIIADQIDDKFEFGCTFKKQSNNQYDRQCDESMQVKQRHRCIDREFHPPGQGTLPVVAEVDGGGFALNAVTGLTGVTGASYTAGVDARRYRRFAEKFFAPMPEQHQTRRDRIEPAALSYEHGQRNAFP